MVTIAQNSGLTSKEAQFRFKKYGPNRLEKSSQFSNFRILLSQFKSPLIYVLLVSGLVTILLKDFTDAVVILAAVVINTIIGFYQEQKAQKSLEALKNLLSLKTKVIRDGSQRIIDTDQVVIGDLISLAIGDRVPADGVLIEATDLTINEAILTGESVPVKKMATIVKNIKTEEFNDQSSAFAGSLVTTGIGKMLIIKTGMQTRMGEIGRQLSKIEEEKTPLQFQINSLAKILALAVGVISVLIFLIGNFFGYDFLQMFTTSVAVAVAAIPEGLAVSLTVILSLGMQRILKQKALVRKLLAAETLGSISVICVDKTGTLTEGQMKVIKWAGLKQDEKHHQLMIKAAILCNDMRDPLETAMMDWAVSQNKNQDLTKQYLRLNEIPFSPKYKYIATLHQQPDSDKQLVFFSGAPEVILAKSKLTDQEAGQWHKKFNNYAASGYRLVGFAYKERKGGSKTIKNDQLTDFNWLGVLIYEDPVRKGVKKVLEACQQAQIKVKVITGDYLFTALAILKKVGIDDGHLAIEGDQLDKLTPQELKKKITQTILFARTTPEQKLKIVQVLKEQGEVVAMMGDGVNDAPALKQADIGIVVGDASDVARQTADIVLLESDFGVILKAIEGGRAIFENIRKVTLYLLAHGFAEVILISGSLLLKLPLPVTAAQILWINLFQDSFPAIALAFEPEEKGLMLNPPRPKKTPILNFELKFLIFVIGSLMNLILLSLFYLLNQGLWSFMHPQTIIFAALGVNSLFIAFACRSLNKQLFSFNPFGNKKLSLAVVFGFLLLVLAIYWPPLQFFLKTQAIGLSEWLVLIALGVFNFLAVELTKMIFLFNQRKELKKATF